MTINEPKGRKARPRPAAPTTPDPVEIAMEIAASGQTPAAAALEVLQTNAALMREQIGLARNERFRNRIKAVRDIALAFVVLLIAAGVIGFVWNARQASGLVIQPLSMPPDLAARGRAIGLPLTELSMGMSHDFAVAIRHGATLVRVGSAIFGARG